MTDTIATALTDLTVVQGGQETVLILRPPEGTSSDDMIAFIKAIDEKKQSGAFPKWLAIITVGAGTDMMVITAPPPA